MMSQFFFEPFIFFGTLQILLATLLFSGACPNAWTKLGLYE